LRTAAKAATLLAVAVSAALALTACGQKHETLGPRGLQRVTLELDFFPNADHAAIYAAIANGDFARAGLDVVPEAPSDPSAPLKLLAAGRADLAISYEPELLLARDKGLALVSIGALVQQPLTSIISIGNKRITSVAQLDGKKIGTAGIPYQSAELQTALQGAGVQTSSVKEINVGFDLVPAMLAGKVDATLGGFWNYEGVQLTLAHKQPHVIQIQNAGVPSYNELVIVAREDQARRSGALLRAFMQGLTRGENAVRADPSRGVQALLKAAPDLNARLQLASVRNTLPVVFPSDASKPFGYQDPQQWAAFGRWMLSHSLLTHDPTVWRAMTNEFLPGLGE
jgi:putative hydroxymethylpyrimidine transport system substrate-binding protein